MKLTEMPEVKNAMLFSDFWIHCSSEQKSIIAQTENDFKFCFCPFCGRTIKALNMSSRAEAREVKAKGIQLGMLHAQGWSDHAPSCPCAWCRVERDNAE